MKMKRRKNEDQKSDNAGVTNYWIRQAVTINQQYIFLHFIYI